MAAQNVSSRKPAFMLSLLWVSLLTTAASGDSWASPSGFTVDSQSGGVVARIEPSSPREPKFAPRVTVSKLEDGKTEKLWSCKLSNRVSPVSAMVSDDGLYVVTFDNWHRVGYGDDVIAFYKSKGQIKQYSLKEALPFIRDKSAIESLQLFAHTVSSRWWHGQNIKLITGLGDSARLCIWLDWAQRWFVWRLEDGTATSPEGQVLDMCNRTARQWAHTRLQLGEPPGKPTQQELRVWNEAARSWSWESSRRMQSKLVACRFLAFAPHPSDRELLLRQLESGVFQQKQIDTTEHGVRTAETTFVEIVSLLRQEADRALAIQDDKAKDFHELGERGYYLLGSADLFVRLPSIVEKEGSQILVTVQAVDSDESPATPVGYRFGKSFKTWEDNYKDTRVRFLLHGIAPGDYSVHVICQNSPPFKYDQWNLHGAEAWRAAVKDPAIQEGDFASDGRHEFAVRTGQTTTVEIACKVAGARR